MYLWGKLNVDKWKNNIKTDQKNNEVAGKKLDLPMSGYEEVARSWVRNSG